MDAPPTAAPGTPRPPRPPRARRPHARRPRLPAGLYRCPRDLAGDGRARLVLTPFLRWPRHRVFLAWAAGSYRPNGWFAIALWLAALMGVILVGVEALDVLFPALAERLSAVSPRASRPAGVFLILLSGGILLLFPLVGVVHEFRKRVRPLRIAWGHPVNRRAAPVLSDMELAGAGFRAFEELRFLLYLRLNAGYILHLRTVFPALVAFLFFLAEYRSLERSYWAGPQELVLYLMAHVCGLLLAWRLVLPAYGAIMSLVIVWMDLTSVRFFAAPTDAKRVRMVAGLAAVVAVVMFASSAGSIVFNLASRAIDRLTWFYLVYGGVVAGAVGALVGGRRLERCAHAWCTRRARRWLREGERLYPAALERLGGR